MGRPASGAHLNVVQVGITGTGHHAFHLLDPTSGSCAIQSCTYSEDAPADDKTAVGDSAKSFGNLRKSYTLTGEARFPKASRKLGYAGLITVGSGTGYVSLARTFTLDFDWGEVDNTPLSVSGYPSGSEHFHIYGPKRFPTITGSWEGIRDQAVTEADLFKEGDTVPGLTFRLEDAATDSTIAFSAITTSRTWQANIPGDTEQTYGYGFSATGAITFAGTTPLLPAFGEQVCTDTSGIPTELVVAEAADGTNAYSMYCYLQRASITVPATGPIIVAWTLRGMGPVTSANTGP